MEMDVRRTRHETATDPQIGWWMPNSLIKPWYGTNAKMIICETGTDSKYADGSYPSQATFL